LKLPGFQLRILTKFEDGLIVGQLSIRKKAYSRLTS
jgi:hypothetical protein